MPHETSVADMNSGSRDAARMLHAVCDQMGASPSTGYIVEGLFMRQIEQDQARRLDVHVTPKVNQ